MNKFELDTNNSISYRGKTLYRIRALRSFNDVKEGSLGGYVENINNLSQSGNCWLYEKSKVLGKGLVTDDALLYNNATVFSKAVVAGNAKMFGNSKIFDSSILLDYAELDDKAQVRGESKVGYNSLISGSSIITNAEIFTNSYILDAEIDSNLDILSITINETITAYRAINGEILINTTPQVNVYTLDEFANMISSKSKDDKSKYNKVLKFIKSYFSIKG